MKRIRTTTSLAAVAATLVVSGCGPTAKLSLDLRTVSVTVPVQLSAPAATLLAPSAPAPAPLPVPPVTLGELPPVPVTLAPNSASSAPRPAADSCPTASEFAVPALPAALTVTSPPAAQSMVEKATGAYTAASGTGRLNDPVQTNVTRLSAQTSTLGQQVIAWQVQEVDTTTKTRQVEVYDVVEPSSAPGATAAGVYLVGLSWNDRVRGDLSFQPSGNGVEVLPSPISISSSNAQFEGIATDPSSLTTLALVGNVTGDKRVDLCGHVVDTWTDVLTGTLTTASAQWKVAWTFQWATAYGAAAVQEGLSLASASSNATWSRVLTSTVQPKAAS